MYIKKKINKQFMTSDFNTDMSLLIIIMAGYLSGECHTLSHASITDTYLLCVDFSLGSFKKKKKEKIKKRIFTIYR